MMFDFSPDLSGKYRRITIEQKITDTDPVLAVQLRLAALFGDFTPYPFDDLHVTYLHLGRVNELRAEVLVAGGDVSLERFLHGVQSVVLVGLLTGDKALEVRLSRLDIFVAASARVVVALLDLDPEWIKARERMLSTLSHSLQSFGISDPDRFMATSPNLKFGSKAGFAPHVSLGTVPEGFQLSALANAAISLPTIRLEPTVVRNAPRLYL